LRGCENKRTRGVLSKETVREAVRNPRAKQLGFSFEAFDIGRQHPDLVVGPVIGRKVKTFLRIHEDDVLEVLPSEVDGGPFRINAAIADRSGRLIFKIVENEWRTPSDNWDVETVGQRIIVRQRIGDISLVVRTDPPNRLTFERINLAHRGTRIFTGGKDDLFVITNRGNVMRTHGVEAENSEVLIDVGKNGELSVGCGGSVFIREARFGGSVRRNTPCPCEGGRRFKHCHGRYT
jgi:hypothetical protein